jgi:DNA polymerase-3 subunit epsilon
MSSLRLKAGRWWHAHRIHDNPLARLLKSPLPAASTPFAEAEFVCLDIETTGLDASTAEMLSIGWVLVKKARVEIGTAVSRLVRPPGEVGDSATVHGLTDTVVEAGHDVLTVLPQVLEVLEGRTLVVHFAGLDKALLDRLCLQHYGAPLLVPVVDTLALEQRLVQRRHHLDDKRSLRLSALRSDYNLPRYSAHDALADAIATAELLLAMVAARGASHRVTLGELLS